MSEHQQHFDLTWAPKPQVKNRQLQALKLPRVVGVELTDITAAIEDIANCELKKYDGFALYVVPHAAWLDGLKKAIENLNEMRDRHQREETYLRDLIMEILNQSCHPTSEQLVRPAVAEPDIPEDFFDPDEVPF